MVYLNTGGCIWVRLCKLYKNKSLDSRLRRMNVWSEMLNRQNWKFYALRKNGFSFWRKLPNSVWRWHNWLSLDEKCVVSRLWNLIIIKHQIRKNSTWLSRRFHRPVCTAESAALYYPSLFSRQVPCTTRPVGDWWLTYNLIQLSESENVEIVKN